MIDLAFIIPVIIGAGVSIGYAIAQRRKIQNLQKSNAALRAMNDNYAANLGRSTDQLFELRIKARDIQTSITDYELKVHQTILQLFDYATYRSQKKHRLSPQQIGYLKSVIGQDLVTKALNRRDQEEPAV
jgi:hypothetical protein